MVPFFVRDDTGTIYVNPEGADFKLPVRKKFVKKAGLSGTISKAPLTEIPPDKKFLPAGIFTREGDQIYTEMFIAPNDTVYILGSADSERGTAYIHRGENEKTFIISSRSEKELLKTMSLEVITIFVGETFLAGIGAYLIVK